MNQAGQQEKSGYSFTKEHRLCITDNRSGKLQTVCYHIATKQNIDSSGKSYTGSSSFTAMDTSPFLPRFLIDKVKKYNPMPIHSKAMNCDWPRRQPKRE